MKTKLALEMRVSPTQEVQLICNCCGQPYYPNKSWEDRIRAIIFGAEKYSVCPLCTQEVPSDVFEDGGYRKRCQGEVARLQQMGFYSLSHQQVVEQVGLSRPKATAVIRYLNIKEDGECFRCFQFGKTKINRYSTKAVEKVKAALPQLDIAAIWTAYRKSGKASCAKTHR
jgi:hypothetical protein